MTFIHKLCLTTVVALSCVGYTTQVCARAELDQKADLIQEILTQLSHIQNLAEKSDSNDIALATLRALVSEDAIDFDRLQKFSLQDLETLNQYNKTIELALEENKPLEELSFDQFSNLMEQKVVKKRTALGQFLVNAHEFAEKAYLKQIAYRTHPYLLWVIFIAYRTPKYKLEEKYPKVFVYIKDILKSLGLNGCHDLYTYDIDSDSINPKNGAVIKKKKGFTPNKVKAQTNSELFKNIFDIDVKAPIKISLASYIGYCMTRDAKDIYNWSKEKYSELYEYLTQEYEVLEA